ncbi:hypothetical protein FRB94_014551 [Tulasnella sp. JGI-2019a]|nr:hypothetical protein FRB94_014551 [Tulasnella sp. JGI-2019a]
MSSVLSKLPYSDHVFKTEIGPTPVSVRIWPTSNVSAGKPAPFFFWIHGGAWIVGTHRLPRPWAVEAFVKAGYHFVSCEYRLLPEVELKDMLQDLLDGLEWCKKELPRIVDEDKVDVTRFAVGGESAGGTNAAMLGHLASPPPLAVLNLYGIVDFLFPQPPAAVASGAPPIATSPFTEVQLAAALANRDQSETLTEVLDDWVNADPSSLQHSRYGEHPRPVFGKRQKLRRAIFGYMISHSMLRQTLFHIDDPDRQVAQYEKKKREMSALALLDDAKTYPPTYVYHGTADEGVPISQSDGFVAKLKEKGFTVEYKQIPGGAHVCDQYEDENSEEWKEHVLPIVAFIDKHVKV